MAVGVPENEVFAAADAVLARGERPTVERVRLELGRGSPARVGGLLDIWWTRLAERLNGEIRLPTLPSEVSQAFVSVWQQATHLAQSARTVQRAGTTVDLTAREWALFEAFVQRPSALFSKSQLEERLYAFGAEIESNTIEVYISRLRKKLGRDLIETVRGMGYRLAAA